MTACFSLSDVLFRQDEAHHDAAVEAICHEAFGPGRFVRAAERVREMTPHDRTLSFVADHRGTLVGVVRQTPVAIGTRPVLMLGPLAVRPFLKGKGVGRALMAMAADAARRAGESVVFLIGDRSYYGPLGYVPLPVGSVMMPGPVDERRILGLALTPGALEGMEGPVRRR